MSSLVQLAEVCLMDELDNNCRTDMNKYLISIDKSHSEGWDDLVEELRQHDIKIEGLLKEIGIVTCLMSDSQVDTIRQINGVVSVELEQEGFLN